MQFLRIAATGDDKRRDRYPIGRMATAQDLTGMAIFLASAEADYVVAQCFGVDGGNWRA